ncbi:type II toxin-antitoxin system HicA family toxin [Geminocystis sp. GBBB08]|uniref:type II toxin-antitoxin system HicA family toxin n=1 Tax=Geminocystis sp. GBBB08 TaxID=2604140 RepID=UPI0027E24333|nr:type II toxin-antitoxin system HicA family toxin [Geminocystis sp. GBBB08]MBL1209481.1 addiction module toxin, HicA family [Geminocystis sp. GBBB08]
MNSKEIIKKLTQDGWYQVKVTGSHYHFKHPIKQGKASIFIRDSILESYQAQLLQIIYIYIY